MIFPAVLALPYIFFFFYKMTPVLLQGAVWGMRHFVTGLVLTELEFSLKIEHFQPSDTSMRCFCFKIAVRPNNHAF